MTPFDITITISSTDPTDPHYDVTRAEAIRAIGDALVDVDPIFNYDVH